MIALCTLRMLTTLFILGTLLTSVQAIANTYPIKPVKIIVPYSTGGGTDTLARLFAQKLGQQWNVPVVVENQPGAVDVVLES